MATGTRSAYSRISAVFAARARAIRGPAARRLFFGVPPPGATVPCPCAASHCLEQACRSARHDRRDAWGARDFLSAGPLHHVDVGLCATYTTGKNRSLRGDTAL